MTAELSAGARRVAEALRRAGCALTVVELPASTRTAAEAALAIGCEVVQIAKSLVFRRTADDVAVLAIASGAASGASLVDEAKLAALAGGAVERASPEFVRRRTGFAIGGVPPVGHDTPLLTFLDRDLLSLPTIWAAAGSPHAVFRLAPDELVALTGAPAVDLTRSGT